MGKKTIPLATRFWAKVDKKGTGGCWLWTGATGSAGYGLIYNNGKVQSAHRVSWEMHNGDIITGDGYHGICVLHKCDVKSCVRPDHLFLGSHQDNITDKEKKGRGRQAKGSAQYLAKLTESNVLAIRALRKSGWPTALLAQKYGVNPGAIWQVVNRKTWRHV